MDNKNLDIVKLNSELDKDLKTNNNFRPMYTCGFIVLLILVSIAYASLAINLGVKIDSSEVKGEETPIVVPDIIPPEPPRELNWKIILDNVQEQVGSVTPLVPATIESSKISAYFSIELKEPGEYYMFTIDVVNKGEVDAKLYNIVKTQLSPKQQKYLKYIITYADGTEIKTQDRLNVNERKTLLVLVEFDGDVEPEDLPNEVETLDLSYKMTYVER